MRIRPTTDTAAPLGGTGPAPAATEGAEFATTLAEAEGDVAEAEEQPRPLAERWGEYGRGAQPGGYGPAPDANDYAGFPTGPGWGAHPLNPRGVTMDPAFTVPGYTGRGTPVPPGFYNIAYYNQYLREGGTPLEGFPALAKGATITDTYGSFGDGRTRATSFTPPPATPTEPTEPTEPDPCDHTTPGVDDDGLTPAEATAILRALAKALSVSTDAATTPSAANDASTASASASESTGAAADATDQTAASRVSSNDAATDSAADSGQLAGSLAELAAGTVSADVEAQLAAVLNALLRG